MAPQLSQMIVLTCRHEVNLLEGLVADGHQGQCVEARGVVHTAGHEAMD